LLNILGRSYAKKTEIADAGFTMQKTAVALGTGCGVGLIALTNADEIYNLFLAIICTLVLSAGTIVFSLLTPSGRRQIEKSKVDFLDDVEMEIEPNDSEVDIDPNSNEKSTKSIWKTLVFCVLVAIFFWFGFLFVRKLNISNVSYQDIKGLVYRGIWREYIKEILLVVTGVILTIIWTRRNCKSEMKVSFSLLFLALAFLMVWFRNGSLDVVWLILFGAFTSISLFLIEPIIYSIMAKKIPAKWLGTSFGLMLSIGIGITYLVKKCQELYKAEIGQNPIMIALILFSVFGVLGVVLILLNKAKSEKSEIGSSL